ncbi:uricase-like [Asterias rubens]|uniref:uricase-like n=1 Tax=Asterias rubens TaxID=7604 RepID=UPI001455532E|nr:uricase-like [Asterias rubens]
MASGGPRMEFVSEGTYYGKNCVRLLQHRRLGDSHEIKELSVNSHLSLSTHKGFIYGDNSDIIATDSQKNTIFALAKMKGITTPEQFAMDLCQHYLKMYSQVVRAEIYIEQAPWRRMDQSGEQHAHAFIQTQEATRYCVVRQERHGLPTVWAGLKGMTILKTTKSGFAGFVRDKFTSLPESWDRIFSTIVSGKWCYKDISGINFDQAWETCKNTILDVFAGPPRTGVFSPSVQQTLYLSAQKMMAKINQIDQVELEMPNVHYFLADLKKIGMENNDEIMMPTVDPHGIIRAALRRVPNSRL